MRPLLQTLAGERFVFHWSVTSIVACLFLTGLSAFAWLADDLSTATKTAIELVCCSYLALDLFLHRAELSSVTRRLLLSAITVLAIVPWFTLAEMVLPSANQSMIFFLAHASYAPYLYFRYRAYCRENIAPMPVRMGLVLVLVLFCMHWLASFWMMMRPKPEGVDFATAYNLAMYFVTTTVATVGYGDITPNDNATRLYTMGLQILGVGVFGVVIGQVSRLILEADKRKEHARNQLESLVSLFKHYGIPQELQKKSYRFLSHVLANASNDEEQRVLAALPTGLQGELRAFMNAKPLGKVSLFSGCSEACLVAAAAELRQIYFTPDQRIIAKGERGDEMFLIGHGRVEVRDGSDLIASLSDGQCFGEMALVGEDMRLADVVAATHCDAFVLERESFQRLLAAHPDLKANVSRVLQSRRAG